MSLPSAHQVASSLEGPSQGPCDHVCIRLSMWQGVSDSHLLGIKGRFFGYLNGSFSSSWPLDDFDLGDPFSPCQPRAHSFSHRHAFAYAQMHDATWDRFVPEVPYRRDGVIFGYLVQGRCLHLHLIMTMPVSSHIHSFRATDQQLYDALACLTGNPRLESTRMLGTFNPSPLYPLK